VDFGVVNLDVCKNCVIFFGSFLDISENAEESRFGPPDRRMLTGPKSRSYKLKLPNLTKLPVAAVAGCDSVVAVSVRHTDSIAKTVLSMKDSIDMRGMSQTQSSS